MLRRVVAALIRATASESLTALIHEHLLNEDIDVLLP